MTSYEHQYLCQYSIFRNICLNYIRHNTYSVILQKLRQEFTKSLSEMVVGLQSEETEPIEGKSTEPCGISPMSHLLPLTTSGRLHEIVYGGRGRVNSG